MRPRESAGSQGFDWGVPGENLQPGALAFCAWLSSAAGVRAKLTALASGRERTSMSFSRHEESYRSDVGLGKAGSGSDCRRSQRSSASMSFQSAIPWQVALRQSLPPLHRLETILNNQRCRTMIFQRTATTPLIPCLSPGVHSTLTPFPCTSSPKNKTSSFTQKS
jgi:hypothetical protein